MENTVITMPLGLLPNGGLNPEVVFKNIQVMYPNNLALAQRELTAAVCSLYDMGMVYPDFVDSESVASFFGGLSYASVSGSGKSYDFMDGEHANVEILVDVFTDSTYVDSGDVDDMKQIIITKLKSAIVDYIKDRPFLDELGTGVDLILHEIVPVDIIPEIIDTYTTPGAEFKRDVSTQMEGTVIESDSDFKQVSDSGYPVIDLINYYVAGVSGRGNDLFNNPDPGLKETPITEKSYDSITKLTTPRVESIKQMWSPQSKSSDTINNRAEAEKLLKLQN